MDFLELPPEVGILLPETPVLESADHDEPQLFHEVFGLQDVVVCAHL